MLLSMCAWNTRQLADLAGHRYKTWSLPKLELPSVSDRWFDRQHDLRTSRHGRSQQDNVLHWLCNKTGTPIQDFIHIFVCCLSLPPDLNQCGWSSCLCVTSSPKRSHEKNADWRLRWLCHGPFLRCPLSKRFWRRWGLSLAMPSYYSVLFVDRSISV